MNRLQNLNPEVESSRSSNVSPWSSTPTEDDQPLSTASETTQTGEQNSHPRGIINLIRKAASTTSIVIESELEGDMIIWPGTKSFSEEFIPEFFVEAFADPSIPGITTKDQLIMKLRGILEEKNQLMAINHQLQTKAMSYFSKRKTTVTEMPEDKLQLRVDYEAKYFRLLTNWEMLIEAFKQDELQLKAKAEKLQKEYQELESKVGSDTLAFNKLKRESIKGAVNSQTGQKLSQEKANQLLQKEQTKSEQVSNIRIQNFHLKYRVRKRELAVHSKEGLAGGHHMYDFEQLKIENQAYNEKIEERNEELSKFRRKIMNTIQMIAHIKEKVHFTVAENEEIRRNLHVLDIQATKNREILAKTKQVKEKLREEKSMLQQKSGLLGKKMLLGDFKLKHDIAVKLRSELAKLKVSHVEYLAGLKSVNAKIKLVQLENI